MELVKRMALPAIAGWFAFYGSFFLYLVELQKYLVNPNERIASVVLGVATAGLLLTLFMHSILTAVIASVALGRPVRGWTYFSVTRREWRVYAAYLRFLVLCAAVIAVVQFAVFGAHLLGARLGFLTEAALTGGLGFIMVRTGMLIAPVAVARDEGEIVRESWRLSKGSFWRMAATMVPILALGLAIEALGEEAVRATGLFGTPALTLVDFVADYRASLPAILLLVGVAYLLSVILMTAAAVSVYRQIENQRAGDASTP
ncbi:MAG: hypothetical protein KGJ78_13750 [Alphaproteobacteria bacterium]|nr:hypothetical protein [Alphaproteobacteria bacterium]